MASVINKLLVLSPVSIGWLGGLCVVLLLGACDFTVNTPPMYESRAREFLTERNVSASTILKLEERSPLEASEVVLLARFDDVPTLFLLGCNPSTSPEILRRLVQHPVEDVRWGASTNPNTPMELVLQLRTRGKYSTANGYVARNPALPESVIREMFNTKEAAWVDIAMNPSCPVDLMQEIIEKGTDFDRTWLAWNRNLPPAIMASLEKEASEGVARMLSGNPTYLKWRKQNKIDHDRR